MSYVEVKNLTKNFDKVTAVDNISFSVDEKSFLVLLGPSGCGKTTILRMIAGLETPTAGEIRIKDKIMFSSEKGICIPARERGLGLVFQSYALWPHLTVFENIAFGLRVKKMKESDIKKKVQESLAYMRLDDMSERYPQEMSGGQQQRVALARMLASDPPLFLMDEPLSNLDAKLRDEMRAEIKTFHAHLAATTIYVTHDQIEGLTMASNIAVLNNGKIEQMNHPKQIYHFPKNLFVADFIGTPRINLIHGRYEIAEDKVSVVTESGDVLKTSYKKIKTADNRVVMAIRAERISIETNPGENRLKTKIKTVLPAGSETVVYVVYGKLELKVLMQREQELNPGESVFLHFPENDILLFDPETEKLIH
ncbi:MAG: ABC transporter ATP-binding protein [Atribacterota bacterium]|nr:ABC transporter ATP-binding protein [Atribacterota bacterium]MDD5637822.1 ABC transporter ATP-binding protein [Atribacterota bacterium]